MTAPAKAELDVPAGGAVKDGDWMQIAPGERLAMRISSGETNSRYAAMEVIAGPGFGPPLHIHQNEDEHFVVLEGSVSFVCGDNFQCDGRHSFYRSQGRAAYVGKSVRNRYSDARGICAGRS